jgi:hypothetical protein
MTLKAVSVELDRPPFRMWPYLVWLCVLIALVALPYLLFQGTNLLADMIGCRLSVKGGNSTCDPTLAAANMWSFWGLYVSYFAAIVGLPMWLFALALNLVVWRVWPRRSISPESK